MSEERGRMSSVLGVTGLVLGNVQGEGDFEVRGRVQGDVVLTGRVLVAQGGLVLGTIEATQVTVSGTVRGDLIAEEGVEITGSGQVEGNVTSPRVAIESGARVRGHLRTGEEPPVAVRGGQDQRRLERPRNELVETVEASAVSAEEDFEDAPEVVPILAAKPAAVPTPEETPRAAAPLRAGPARLDRVRTDGAPERPEGRGEGGEGRAKRRRKRKRGGDRPATNEAAGPPTDAAGTNAFHVDEARAERTPPQRPTRPSGPLPPAEGAGKGRSPGDEPPDRKRRGKRLPTFVKGARGHLRG